MVAVLALALQRPSAPYALRDARVADVEELAVPLALPSGVVAAVLRAVRPPELAVAVELAVAERALVDRAVFVLQFALACELVFLEVSLVDAAAVLVNSSRPLSVLEAALEAEPVSPLLTLSVLAVVSKLPAIGILSIVKLALSVSFAVFDIALIVRS